MKSSWVQVLKTVYDKVDHRQTFLSDLVENCESPRLREAFINEYFKLERNTHPTEEQKEQVRKNLKNELRSAYKSYVAEQGGSSSSSSFSLGIVYAIDRVIDLLNQLLYLLTQTNRLALRNKWRSKIENSEKTLKNYRTLILKVHQNQPLSEEDDLILAELQQEMKFLDFEKEALSRVDERSKKTHMVSRDETDEKISKELESMPKSFLQLLIRENDFSQFFIAILQKDNEDRVLEYDFSRFFEFQPVGLSYSGHKDEVNIPKIATLLGNLRDVFDHIKNNELTRNLPLPQDMHSIIKHYAKSTAGDYSGEEKARFFSSDSETAPDSSVDENKLKKK